MYFQQISAGGHDKNFSYFAGDEVRKEVMAVDPVNLPLLQEIIQNNQLKIIGIAVTHGHADHYGEAGAFYKLLKDINNTEPKIYIHPRVREKIKLPDEVFHLMHDGEILQIGKTHMQCIFTPGHEPGAVCLLMEEKLLTGDTLFIGGCGRADLKGGNVNELYDSIMQRIQTLPDNTVIYPGHDYGTTPYAPLYLEKKQNRYLLCKSRQEFIKLRMK